MNFTLLLDQSFEYFAFQEGFYVWFRSRCKINRGMRICMNVTMNQVLIWFSMKRELLALGLISCMFGLVWATALQPGGSVRQNADAERSM